jgi:hypothetical protein
MPEPNWASEPDARPSLPSSGKKSKKKLGGTTGGAQATSEMDEVADRTAVIANRLKEIYTKSVYPVEKRYNYDYFFESPFLTDVEFDGKEREASLAFVWR